MSDTVQGVTREELLALHTPFEKELKWRVGATAGQWCQMVAYVDSRTIMARLDRVCKPHNWKQRFYDVGGQTFCEISIRCQVNGHSEWIGKSDTGSESNVEADKGQASDAFKRAAVHWGLNRRAYDLELIWLEKGDKKNTVKLSKGGKDIFSNKPEVQAHCNKVKKYRP